MEPKRVSSKDTTESSTAEAVKQTPVNLPLYSDTQLYVEKEFHLTGQKVIESFSEKDFKEDLEEQKLCINFQISGMHNFSYRYLAFPCADVINWIVSHIDVKATTLSSTSGQRLAMFMAVDY